MSFTRDEPISKTPTPICRDKLVTWTRSQAEVCEQAVTFPRSTTKTATKLSTPSAVFSEYLVAFKTVLPFSQHKDPFPMRTRGLHSQDTSRASFFELRRQYFASRDILTGQRIPQQRDQDARHVGSVTNVTTCTSQLPTMQSRPSVRISAVASHSSTSSTPRAFTDLYPALNNSDQLACSTQH